MGSGSNDTCCLKLIADIQERRSCVPAHLRELGLLVSEDTLKAGDYAVGNDPDLGVLVIRSENPEEAHIGFISC
jgi:ERCC4-type nuclease